MKKYSNLSGRSGVIEYEIRQESILVKFKDGVYEYDYTTVSKHHIENMKLLAESGRGLASYISRYVKDKYKR
jgi:hypothetical protein